MNKQRRVRLSELIDRIEKLKPTIGTFLTEAKDEVEHIRDALVEVKDEEQEALDNMPAGLQDSENGGRMQASVEQLDQVESAMNDLLEALESIDAVNVDDIISQIDDARDMA